MGEQEAMAVHLDVVAGPGSHGPDSTPLAPAPEAMPTQKAVTADALLDLEAAWLVLRHLEGQGPESSAGAVGIPTEALAPCTAADAPEGQALSKDALGQEGEEALSGDSPAPAAAPALAQGLWRQRAQAAEAAATAWSDRMLQAEQRWASERENLKHNHSLLQSSAAEQSQARIRRAHRQTSMVLGLALATVLLGMPAAWLGGSQGALAAAESKAPAVEALNSAREQGHQQVVDALAAQASAAVVAQDFTKARHLWASVADLAKAQEDRDAAQAALTALAQAPAGSISPPKAGEGGRSANAPRGLAAPPQPAAALTTSPRLGRLVLTDEGRPARVHAPLRRAIPAAPPATAEALDERIPDGVRAKF